MVPAALQIVLGALGPVALVVALGMVFGRLRRPDPQPLADVILYVSVPALIFHNMWRQPPPPGDVGMVTLITAVILLVQAALCVATGLWRRFPEQRIAVLFPNAGNLGIPIAALAFGERVTGFSLLFFSLYSVVHYSLGFTLAGASMDWRRIVRMPVLYAVAAGLLAGYAKMPLPPAVDRAIQMTGQIAIPLMLVVLGLHLSAGRFEWSARTGLASVLCVGGGLAGAFLVVSVLGVSGPLRQVALLIGALPAAVINVPITRWAGGDAQAVARTVVVSTAVSAVVLCFLLPVLAG